ncbi:MAG: ParB/RepB/Spo0J family partition protein, partial [Gemmataceae bacterium]
MMQTEKKSRLGRGLEALLGEEPIGATNNRQELALDAIEKSPFQPRKSFEQEDIASLSESIRSHGVLQPLVVRPMGDRYQLIAGERRLRAAELAGLSTVPVTIVDFNDQQSYEAALIENIQRSDLTPIEKAQGFKDYLERYHMTHEQ